MKCLIYFLLSTLFLVSCSKEQKPNVVIFFADDLGWSDLSVNNSDPAYFRHTPNIDEIFTSGITMSNYLTHCVCSPSRAGLLTGTHYAKLNSGPNTGGILPNNICPSDIGSIYNALQSEGSGNYHFYLDNIVIRGSDGNIRRVFWQSKEDSNAVSVKYGKKNFSSISAALSAPDFPLKKLTVSNTKTN